MYTRQGFFSARMAFLVVSPYRSILPKTDKPFVTRACMDKKQHAEKREAAHFHNRIPFYARPP